MVDCIRGDMRVLLVSIETHVGELTWRNLLQSDASIDIVYFIILRPLEKHDGTTVYKLSLTTFPTR